MNLVSQLESNGCGVACLAMVLGEEYAAARERLFGRRKTKPLDVNDLNKAIRRAGRGTKLSWRLYGKAPRIVGLEWPRDSDWTGDHFVVWDPDREAFLDPSPGVVVPKRSRLVRRAFELCAEPVLVVRR